MQIKTTRLKILNKHVNRDYNHFHWNINIIKQKHSCYQFKQ